LRAEAGLLRVIGVRRLTASIINTTIGAGIFVLPAIAAADLGPAAPVAYVVCGVLMTLVIVCFASAGSRVSLTGGLYAYVEVAFGPYIGFIGGVLYWLSATIAVGSVGSAFASSVALLWPVAATPVGRTALLVTLFATLAAVNVRGVKPGARLVEAMTIIKLTPLVVLIVAGVWFVHPEHLAIAAAPAASAIGRTAIVLIFAFVGVEVALVPSGEVVDPARTVPRALFLALAITTTVYLAIQSVAQGLLGPELPRYAAAPLAEAMARVMGAGGRLFVLAGATVSMFGYTAGDMLGSPRALFALARDGFLPATLASVHSRFHTPRTAIIVHAVFVTIIAVSGSFMQLAVIANVSVLTLYLLCALAAYELQRRGVRTSAAPLVTPGGAVVPLLAAAAIVWLLSNATRREFAVEALVVAAASIAYYFRRQVQAPSHVEQSSSGPASRSG
jgi:basic amino acid/polyamine antiporter, APA family